MVNRREWLEIALGTGATLAFTPRLLTALQQGTLIRRAIPSSGEMLPTVGLGSSATFGTVARSPEAALLKEVLRTLVDKGGKVFDTAPSYGASEQVAGDLVKEIGYTSRVFWATKVNTAQGRGGGASTTPAAAKAQIESSFTKFGVTKMDLIQVHNLGDVPTQLGVLKEMKAAGRVRYIGVTTTSDGQYAQLEAIMKAEPLDFIGLDYAADNRNVEERILPLALERKIGVLAYVPFGRTRLLTRAAGKPLPDFAKEIDAATWPQFFVKYVISHPAITCVTPATSKPEHMVDNLTGGMGRLPDAAMRKRMAELVDALPA